MTVRVIKLQTNYQLLCLEIRVCVYTYISTIHTYICTCICAGARVDPMCAWEVFRPSFQIMCIKVTADSVRKIRKSNNIDTYLVICANSQEALRWHAF